MDSILMTESSWRWPRLRSMPLRFFFLKTITFSPRLFSRIFAETEAPARVGNHDAIVPSIAGWARQHGINTIFVDDRDPFSHGFQVQ